MNSYDEFEDQACEELLQAVGNFLAQQERNKIKMVDFDRHRLMMQVAAELKALLAAIGAPGRVEIDNGDSLFDCGGVKAVLDDLSVLKSPRFADLVARADDTEIYPRTDGTYQLDFTFHSLLKTIGYQEEEE